MDLDDAHLRQGDNCRNGIGDEVLTDLRFLADTHTTQGDRAPRLRMPQELTWPRDALRTMNQCQRTSAQVRQNPCTNPLVIAREFKF